MKRSINRQLEYALMALKALNNKPNESMSLKQVCSYTKSPLDITAKVLQKLARSKILISEKGLKGGYRLKNIEKKTLYDLILPISGPVGIVPCLQKEKCSLKDDCLIFKPIVKLNKKIKKFYSDIKIKEMIEDS